MVAVPSALLNHFEPKQIPVEPKPLFEIRDPDRHMMNAYDHRCFLLAQRAFGGLRTA